MRKPVVPKGKQIINIISAIFIFLYAYTAFSKLFEYETFKSVLSLSPLIGNYSTLFAWMVPAAEIIVALMLFIPAFRSKGLYASLAMMIGFTLYIGYILAFVPNRERPCPCGGVIAQLTWNQHLLFNIFFTMLALLAVWLNRHTRREQVAIEKSPQIAMS